jgi:putative nucleotidyltransferase with HDIG domain
MNVVATTTTLVRELERLPAEPTAAMRVLWLADDPNSSSDDLAAVVGADPALTTRIMRMANSAYYGLSGKVRSSSFAITVLGFSTVRSLAAAAAAGVMGDDRAIPPGFWNHAAASATAASLVAHRVSAPRADAFSLGLLHDLGRFLFHRVDPDSYAELTARIGHESPAMLEAEREVYGIDHADAAARVLKAWHFPDDFVDSLARHHEAPGTMKSALGRSLVGGEALARVAAIDAPGIEERYEAEAALAEEEQAALQLVRIDGDTISPLAAQVRRGGAELAATLNSAI